MSKQKLHYITDPLKSFIFSLSDDVAYKTFFFITSARDQNGCLQKTKRLSVRDQIMNGNLETLGMYRTISSWMVLLHARINNRQIKDSGYFISTKQIFVQ